MRSTSEMPEAKGTDVVVVGAIHVDLVVSTSRLPAPGETVVGSELLSLGGGKGANAALAARRGGADVSLLGAVGDDEHAALSLEDLIAAGVRVEGVQRIEGGRTGSALIVVDAEGRNQIAVAPGVGATLSAAAIAQELDRRLADAGCLLVSTEISADAVAQAVRSATVAGVPCLLNSAPPYPGIVDLLEYGPILSPNQGELAELDRMIRGVAKEEPPDPPNHAALRLARRTGAPVVVTLGADGALVVWPGGRTCRLGAPTVAVRDTTGAGDTFNGILAGAVAAGTPLNEAAHIAVVAASLSVRQPGARAGMPDAQGLAAELFAPGRGAQAR